MAPVTPGQARVHATAIAATVVRCPSGDWPQGVGESKIAAQPVALKIRRTEAPIIRPKLGRALHGECAREQARLHRTVDDDAGLMVPTPGKLRRSKIAVDQREWRLQRVDMPYGFGPRQLIHIVVGQSYGARPAFLFEIEQGLPILLDRRSVLGRPVHLVQVDLSPLQPPKRGVHLAANTVGSPDPTWRGRAIALVPHQAAFGEDERTLACWNATERLATTSSECPRPTAAVSIQFTPCSTACWMAEIESASSCLPQLKAQPAPPMAQAPKPTRVMRMPVVPKSAIDSEVLRALVNVIRLVSRYSRRNSNLRQKANSGSALPTLCGYQAFSS